MAIIDEKELKKEIKKATKLYTNFHWGLRPDKTYSSEIPDPPGVVVDLGYLRAVIYETVKKGDGSPIFYIHSFDRIFPILSTDPQAKSLFISGGNFKIKPEGIVG